MDNKEKLTLLHGSVVSCLGGIAGLLGVYAFQSSRLGRLGLLGAGAAMLCMLAKINDLGLSIVSVEKFEPD